MGVFDGEVTRIRALIPARGEAAAYEVMEFIYGKAEPIVAGFKAQGAIAVRVDDLHYVTAPQSKLSYGEVGEEWGWE